MRLLISVGKPLFVGLALSLAFATLALADGIEGTWRLIKTGS